MPFPDTSNADRMLMRIVKLSSLDVRMSCREVLVACHVSFRDDGFETMLFVCNVFRVRLQLFKDLGIVFRVTGISWDEGVILGLGLCHNFVDFGVDVFFLGFGGCSGEFLGEFIEVDDSARVVIQSTSCKTVFASFTIDIVDQILLGSSTLVIDCLL